MIVCVCKRVSDAQLRDAVHDGEDSLEALGETLGVGTNCGACIDFACELIADCTNRDPATAVLA